MSLLFAGVEKRLLFELAKLTQEVKHLHYEVKELRRMMETTVPGTVSVEKVDVPQIDKGPIITLAELKPSWIAVTIKMFNYI